MAPTNGMKPGTGPGWTTYAPPAHELLTHKLSYEVHQFADDCRGFAQAARDAQLNDLPMKFGQTWEAFCERQLHQSAEFVEAIILGVEVLGEELPIPADVALKIGRKVKQTALAQRNREAAAVQVRTRGGQAGNQNGAHGQPKSNTDNNKKDVSIRTEKHGNSAAYALRRLRDSNRQDLVTQCLAGELTPHAAMVQAGFRAKPPSRKRTPLDYLHKYWRQVAPEDRLRFLVEMLTPNERRAICLGFDEED